MEKILVTCKQMQVELPRYREQLESLGYEVIAPELSGQQFTSAELVEFMPDVVGLIAGDDELDREFFLGSPTLRTLVRWGIGMDSVDHAAAADASVVVRNTPGVFGQEVADMALGYMLSLARGINEVDRSVRAGDWPKFEGFTLSGQTVGVVGFGAIGREVATRAAAFGMSILIYDPFTDPATIPEGMRSVSFSTLLQASRFVTLTCPLTPETHHLIDAEALSQMNSEAYLVNVARGPVVDEKALVESLESHQIAGAGLDVFEVEPLPMNSKLRSLPNVILGSHNGSNTRQGVARASSAAVGILLEELGHQ
ncbi:phosphoglycerate dehydrogenase [Arthrobacter sp. BHU FT2]|nr:phosphoglycerate dehydrogenase [Arthrobacter sp. BHU FT2]